MFKMITSHYSIILYHESENIFNKINGISKIYAYWNKEPRAGGQRRI